MKLKDEWTIAIPLNLGNISARMCIAALRVNLSSAGFSGACFRSMLYKYSMKVVLSDVPQRESRIYD